MNIIYVVLLQALYGTTFTISKILVQYTSPIFIIGIRMTIAGSLLLAYHKFIQKQSLNLPTKLKRNLFKISVFNIFLPYALRYWSLTYLTATKVALLYNLIPFISYVMAYFMGRETMSQRKWLGLTVGFAGFLPALLGGTPTENALGMISFISLPELAMIGAVTSFSYSWIVMQKIVKKNTISPIAINGVSMLIGGLLALITSFMFETNHTIAKPFEFFSWLALIMLITNFICYNLYAVLLKHFSPTLMALAGLSAPIFAALTSWFFLGEILSWETAVSAIMTFIGFFLFYKAEAKSTGKKIEMTDYQDY